MWGEIFKDIKPRKEYSKPPQERCHYDNWERPSDRFAKMDGDSGKREGTKLTDWSTTSTMNPSRNHERCHYDNWERPSDRFAKMDGDSGERENNKLTDWSTTSTMNPSPNHERCHYDNWERPSDRFAKMDGERAETKLTDWPTTSTMNPSPNHEEDDEQSEESGESDDEQSDKVSDESEASKDDPNEYDKYWDSSSELEDLATYQSTTKDTTSTRKVENPEGDDQKPTDNKSQEQKLDSETLVTVRIVETPLKKVPLFKYPPGYDKNSTGPPRLGFANTPASSLPTPSRVPQPVLTPRERPEDTRTIASQLLKHFAIPPSRPIYNYYGGSDDLSDPPRAPMRQWQHPEGAEPTSSSSIAKRRREPSRDNSWCEDSEGEGGSENTGDRIPESTLKAPEEMWPDAQEFDSWSYYLSDLQKAKMRKRQLEGAQKTAPSIAEMGQDSSKAPGSPPTKSDNSWSGDSGDEDVPEDVEISTDSAEKVAEDHVENPEKTVELEPTKAAEPSLPTQPWYAEIEEAMKALVLHAAGGSQKRGRVERVASPSLEEKEEEPEPEETVDLEQLVRLVEIEHKDNVFSPFYATKTSEKRSRNSRKKEEDKTPRPGNYTHTQAIRFAAKSHLWKDAWDRDLPNLPVTSHRIIELPAREPSRQVFAFYRVLAEQRGKYILIACNVNVHGFHRGDLRFLEVNFKTKLRGFAESVMGNLFLGDILAVTELARSSESRFSNNNFQVSAVSQDSKCYWMVSKAILYPRSIAESVTFVFVKNRTAVVKGDDEPMTVCVEDWNSVKVDSIYAGAAFRPIKLDDTFSSGFMKSCRQQVVLKALRIATYPNAFGTIFHYAECPQQNEEFLIGTRAFSPSIEMDVAKREKVVETCSLMGFSAANTIFNGRFDCRAFYMQDIRKAGLNVSFRIVNPLGNPTLGLWNAGNRIRFGGPFGDVNACIETVIESDSRLLKIVARMSRDCPRNMSFDDGEFFVWQRELMDTYSLTDGYLHRMDDGSNGKRIIQTLYGGKALEVVKDPNDPPVQYFFPSIPDRLPLNQYQNEYVQMLLDGNPLVIGSSPFGCGKSMTIITAALEIYKRNCKTDLLKNQSHQLLITQSNFASVNLIEITKRICASKDGKLSGLKFARYVSEKNWNELSEHCQTDHDMPHLMKEVFREWAVGNIDESDRRLQRLHTHHFRQMIAFLLKNTQMSPEEFDGAARRTYNKNPEPKPVQSGVVTEAFFALYQPDIIMTTADSSKGLLDVLKEVRTVQIDEASQLPEYTLLGLLKTFSTANFGLIGDIHQLPPYCEEMLDGRLKEFGIGNTMKRAIEGALFPISTLRFVYRCHPKTTQLLSELFYDGSLISGITEDQRDGFMRSRADLWPNPNFPMMILNHTGNSFKMGTSTGNQSEKELVGCLVQNLLSHRRHALKSRDIGVISFYSAQTSILTEHLRSSRVKCGTVDAFQGTEKEVIIVCCTNATISGFMQDKNRLNVALSRAKQAAIIIGNVERLARAQYWSTIVKRVKAYGNLRQANDRNLFNSQKAYCSPCPPPPHNRRDHSPSSESMTLVKNPYYMGSSNDKNQPSCSSSSPSPGPGPSSQSYALVRNPYYVENQQEHVDNTRYPEHHPRALRQEQQHVDNVCDPEHHHRAPSRQEPNNGASRGRRRRHRGHRASRRPESNNKNDSNRQENDVMRGQWNTTTHSFRRADGYQYP